MKFLWWKNLAIDWFPGSEEMVTEKEVYEIPDDSDLGLRYLAAELALHKAQEEFDSALRAIDEEVAAQREERLG